MPPQNDNLKQKASRLSDPRLKAEAERLFKEYRGMVYHQAKRIGHSLYPIEDRIANGELALWKGIISADPSHPRFVSYLRSCVIWGMRSGSNAYKPAPLPYWASVIGGRAYRRLRREGREETRESVSAAVRQELLALGRSTTLTDDDMYSLYMFLKGRCARNSGCLDAILAGECDGPEPDFAEVVWRRVAETVSEGRVDLLRKHFVEGLSLREISSRANQCSDAARKRYETAMKHLRRSEPLRRLAETA